MLSSDPGSQAARDAVRAVREAVRGIPETFVGGTEARQVDADDAASRDRGVIFPLILGLVLLSLCL